MMDFNIGELKPVFSLNGCQLFDKGGFFIIYANDDAYFTRKSIYVLLPEYNEQYINQWINKALEFKIIENRANEINADFLKVLNDDFILNTNDVEYVINGANNWVKLIKNLNGGKINIQV